MFGQVQSVGNLVDSDQKVFEDIGPLQHYLAEVMIAAFESLQNKKHMAISYKETGQGNQEENMK